MSRDVFVIHSSEVDDVSLVESGWYVAEAYPEETLTADMLHDGPHASHDAAIDAMRNWLLS